MYHRLVVGAVSCDEEVCIPAQRWPWRSAGEEAAAPLGWSSEARAGWGAALESSQDKPWGLAPSVLKEQAGRLEWLGKQKHEDEVL